MSKFLDGIQQTIDTISSFDVVGSGTINVGTNQYPTSTDITPTKLYRNFALFYQNKSGQTLSNVTPVNKLATQLPNVASGSYLTQAAISASNNANNGLGVSLPPANMFAFGTGRLQFNLAAVPTSGTIDWVLIGY